MNWKTIFNPFSKYSESQLLITGIASKNHFIIM
jgi:hypothetical protein